MSSAHEPLSFNRRTLFACAPHGRCIFSPPAARRHSSQAASPKKLVFPRTSITSYPANRPRSRLTDGEGRTPQSKGARYLTCSSSARP